MSRGDGTAIVFFHTGDKRTLDIALRQACRAAPDSAILLLTDEIRDLDLPVRQYAAADHLDDFRDFAAHYRHVSVNPASIELLCYARWFAFRSLARAEGLQRFCMFDSDILLYRPVEDFAAAFAGHLAGSWAWANCITDIEALDRICAWFAHVHGDAALLDAFAGKYAVGGRPHLSDMVLLLELAAADPAFLSQSGFQRRGYDQNMQQGKGFEMDGPVKRVVFDADGVPVCRLADDGTSVRFTFLHFQGEAKRLMARYAWPS